MHVQVKEKCATKAQYTGWYPGLVYSDPHFVISSWLAQYIGPI